MKQFAVPFAPEITTGTGYAQAAAEQLNELIDKSTTKGWEFSHVEQIVTYRQNGCLAALMGNPETPIFIQVVILKRD